MANAVNLLIIVHYGIPIKLLIFLMIVQMVGIALYSIPLQRWVIFAYG